MPDTTLETMLDTPPETTPLARRSLLLGGAAAAAVGATGMLPSLAEASVAGAAPRRTPLWKKASRCGVVFGSSIATWQLDGEYGKLHGREAGLMFTEDDLLWYQLKPRPHARLNFDPGDRIVRHARKYQQLRIGAHLVWDEGFGEGWTDEDLWDISRRRAERLLYGTVRKEVRHYKGKMNGWIVANEVTDPEFRNKHGFRKNVPWFQTIGPEYIRNVFEIAAEEDPKALRIINEFGFETVNEWGDKPGPPQARLPRRGRSSAQHRRARSRPSGSRGTCWRTASASGSTRRSTAPSSRSSPTAACRS